MNPKAKLIILGQEPGHDEVAEGAPFVGRSGRLLNRTLDEFNIKREIDCHVTNALLCQPRRRLTAAENYQAMVACRGRLFLELSSVDARHVAALGALALRTLTGRADIFSWFGGPLAGAALDTQTARTKRAILEGALADFSPWTVVPTLHPAFCLRAPAYTPVMQTHVARVWDLVTGTLKPWKWPELYLYPDAAALAALKRIKASRLPIAVDVETDGIEPLSNTLRVLGLSNGADTVSLPWNAYTTKRAGNVASLWDSEYGDRIYVVVKQILESKHLVFQNGQHDILSIHSQTKIRIPPQNYIFDTLLAHAVVAPRLRHYLDHIACVEFHMPMWKSEFGNTTDQKGAERYFNRPEIETRDYNAKDALITALLVEPLMARLQEEPRGKEQHAILLAKMKIAMRMKERGILVDITRFSTHRKHFVRRAGEAKKALHSIAEAMNVKAPNPNAHKQLHNFFFGALKVAPSKWSEETGAPSLDEEALHALLHHQDDKVRLAARHVLQFRRWDKLRGTYIDGLPYDSDYVVHAGWKVYGARTGRWSSSPNLQNIPKPKLKVLKNGKCVVEVPGLRDIFVSRQGSYLVEADYKALELRIATLLSGDALFVENFTNGVDPHTDTAARVFEKEPADITKDERFISKTANYQMIYGGSPIELWKKVTLDFPNVALWTIEKLHERWFDIHRGIYVWQQETIRDARRHGYVECPFSGRRQYYLDGNIDINEVLNFPVQGTGADIIDPALVELSSMLNWKNDAVLLQVHDALVCETKNVKRMAGLLRKTMVKTLEYKGRSMTFDIDVKHGLDWANMEEL